MFNLMKEHLEIEKIIAKKKEECYPGSAMVLLPNNSWLPASDIRRGQKLVSVSVSSRAVWEDEMIMDFHDDSDHHDEFTFLKVSHTLGELTISPNHFVATFHDGMVPAYTITEKSILLGWDSCLSKPAPAYVNQISSVKAEGLYCFLTNQGSAVVDGIVVSSYTMDQVHEYIEPAKVSEAVAWFGGFNRVHAFIHKLTFFHRFLRFLPEMVQRNSIGPLRLFGRTIATVVALLVPKNKSDSACV